MSYSRVLNFGRKSGDKLFSTLQEKFIGLDTFYPVIDGQPRCRVYLDSAAATLMWEPVHEFGRNFLSHYSNTHSKIHHAARISSDVVEWGRKEILVLLGADPEHYVCFFTGSGSTSGFNRLARMFSAASVNRPMVFVSAMEHHSNDLPHRQFSQVKYIPIIPNRGIDSDAFRRFLEQYADQVNYVSYAAVSNVTGIVNPIQELTQIAHSYGVPVIVDGAQAVAHTAIQLSTGPAQVDAFVFSGHKLYTPGSPGVVVIKRSLLERLGTQAVEFGGGMVEDVYYDDFDLVQDPVARQEAGTLNIPGIAMLGATANLLKRIGMHTVEAHERELQAYAFERFSTIKDVIIYGDKNLTTCPRAGGFAFNIRGIPHSLTAAILNDYFSIAVRNQCFCAHPYVRELLREDFINMPVEGEDVDHQTLMFRGMVRVSFGLYSHKKDIDKITEALEFICADPEHFTCNYKMAGNVYKHNQQLDLDKQFDSNRVLATIIGGSIQ